MTRENFERALVKCHSHFNVFCAVYAGYLVLAEIDSSASDSPTISSYHSFFSTNCARITINAFVSLTQAVSHAIKYYTHEDKGIFNVEIEDTYSLQWTSTEDGTLNLRQKTPLGSANIEFLNLTDVFSFAHALRHCFIHASCPNLVEVELVEEVLRHQKEKKHLPTQFPEEHWKYTVNEFLVGENWRREGVQNIDVRTRRFWRSNWTTINCMSVLERLNLSARGGKKKKTKERVKKRKSSSVVAAPTV